MQSLSWRIALWYGSVKGVTLSQDHQPWFVLLFLLLFCFICASIHIRIHLSLPANTVRVNSESPSRMPALPNIISIKNACCVWSLARQFWNILLWPSAWNSIEMLHFEYRTWIIVGLFRKETHFYVILVDSCKCGRIHSHPFRWSFNTHFNWLCRWEIRSNEFVIHHNNGFDMKRELLHCTHKHTRM